MTQAAAVRLEALMARMAACRICHDRPLGKPLPHDPRPVFQLSTTARILLAGQAPGTRVHASGRPFTDPSGVRLRQWLGVSEADFYDSGKFAILPMGFCFPGLSPEGADLPPRKECAPAWRRDCLDALPQVELIVCLGSHAMAWHLGKTHASVDSSVRNWRRGLDLSPRVIALPHPSWRNNSWLKVNPWFEAELVPVLRRLVAELL